MRNYTSLALLSLQGLIKHNLTGFSNNYEFLQQMYTDLLTLSDKNAEHEFVLQIDGKRWGHYEQCLQYISEIDKKERKHVVIPFMNQIELLFELNGKELKKN